MLGVKVAFFASNLFVPRGDIQIYTSTVLQEKQKDSKQFLDSMLAMHFMYLCYQLYATLEATEFRYN